MKQPRNQRRYLLHYITIYVKKLALCLFRIVAKHADVISIKMQGSTIETLIYFMSSRGN